MASIKGHIHILQGADELSRALADYWLRLCREAVQQRGRFMVALSGGSTPRLLHEVLAQAPYRDAVEWEKVWVFFGDERSVPQDHPQSNYHMAVETLLSQVPIPATQVFPMFAPALDAPQNAQHYAAQLAEHVPLDAEGWPVFDLILLGMGDDGHTASLFPGTSILQEAEKSVAAVYVDKLVTWRVSLTYPVLNHARHIAVMVAGAGKAETLRQVAQSAAGSFPIQGIAPVAGELHWFLDRAAAARLPQGET